MSYMSDAEIADLNRMLKRWAAQGLPLMKMLASGKSSLRKRSEDEMGRITPSLSTSLRNVNKRDGTGRIEGIGFKFPRHGVFFAMGVFGGLNREQSAARGFQGKDWYGKVMQARLPLLNDLLAEKYKGMVLRTAKQALDDQLAGAQIKNM